MVMSKKDCRPQRKRNSFIDDIVPLYGPRGPFKVGRRVDGDIKAYPEPVSIKVMVPETRGCLSIRYML